MIGSSGDIAETVDSILIGMSVNVDVVSLERYCVVASVVDSGLAVLKGLLRTRGRAVTLSTSLYLSLQPCRRDEATNTGSIANI
jgi:hypothetical protein